MGFDILTKVDDIVNISFSKIDFSVIIYIMKLSLKGLFKNIGPGFITGTSDDDPSGIAAYTQVGAQFGFGMLWTAFLMLPLMISAQEMSARIGLVSGQGIVAILKKHYPKIIVYVFVALILVANTINIGADIGAIADCVHLIIPQIPFTVLAIGLCVMILSLEILVSYKHYVNILKWLGLCLLSYALTLILVTNNWSELLFHAFIPQITFNQQFMIALTAVLGTTISPYLFIWQGNEEVEEEIAIGRTSIKKRRGATKKEIRGMRWDTVIGMAFSNIITFCIIATAANTFFKNGIFDITSTAQAAQALEPLAGRFASLVFSFGVIGTGLLAIPILSASASYALSETLNWREGLYRKFHQAHGFYGVITAATAIGLLINFIGINPIKALFWAAVLNGIVTPILLAVIIKVANNKKVMGKYKNGKLSNTFTILTLILTALSASLIFIF